MSIVAHEDDDILFLSPDLLHDIQSGRCVRTVFVTAGDDNRGLAYAEDRVIGAKAAYASMAGVPSGWSTSELFVSGHRVTVHTLQEAPRLTLVFLRLPDGAFDGNGFSKDHKQSLRKLLHKQIQNITSIDGADTYSLKGISDMLLALITDYRPDQLRAQDDSQDFDHSDHRAVAALVHTAEQQYLAPHTFTTYRDYITIFHRPNLSAEDLLKKKSTFGAYAATDSQIGCFTCIWNPYYYWLKTQYVAQVIQRK
jgi:LmbE family N-acetylglucosaminyl deacetylase